MGVAGGGIGEVEVAGEVVIDKAGFFSEFHFAFEVFVGITNECLRVCHAGLGDIDDEVIEYLGMEACCEPGFYAVYRLHDSAPDAGLLHGREALAQWSGGNHGIEFLQFRVHLLYEQAGCLRCPLLDELPLIVVDVLGYGFL
jgi:hypothetical protein